MFFDKSPMFLYDSQWLCFGVPNKNSLPIEGYYVNIKSGEIQYRKSNILITKKDKKVSISIFLHKETIREGKH